MKKILFLFSCMFFLNGIITSCNNGKPKDPTLEQIKKGQLTSSPFKVNSVVKNEEEIVMEEDIHLSFNADGTYIFSNIDKLPDPLVEAGTWIFLNDNFDKIQLNGAGTEEFLDINTLSDTDFVFSYSRESKLGIALIKISTIRE